MLFCQLRQKVGAVHVIKTVAQIGYPVTVAVIVGSFCVAGKKTFRGRIMAAIALQHILIRVKRGEHKCAAPHPMGLHEFISVAETRLQRLQAVTVLVGAQPLVPFFASKKGRTVKQ